MNIINNKTVVIFTSEELKNILENEDNYQYIYLGSNITLESTISISKPKITIDGTYMNTRYKLTGMNSITNQDTICVTTDNIEVTIKNMDIEYTNIYGVIYVPLERKNVLVTYTNIKFRGTQLSFNPYGTTKIIDSIINIEPINSVPAQEACESNQIIIGGNTSISSTSIDYSIFSFKNDTTNPSVIFLCKSEVTLITDTKDFMNGTNKLNFTILHDTTVSITAGNGFATKAWEGANNVLIDERATLILLENKHQRVPMWSIYGSLTVKKDATLQVINSYDATPTDNYNIYFKGNNPVLTLDNPKEVVIYTKNANTIYTTNPLTYKIKCSRINLWNDSEELASAGTITNLPDYFWYKEDNLLEIEGTMQTNTTSITTHNLTTEELNELPELTNFKFQNKKQLSIGHIKTNIHAINSSSTRISGHSYPLSSILVKYNGNNLATTANNDGLFEINITDTIVDNTKIEIISNIPSSFLYETRKITTPHNGELSLMDIDLSLIFSLTQINNILPRKKELTFKIVDSRINKNTWHLSSYITTPLTSLNGFTLDNAFIFKKIDNEIIVLNENPQIIYEGTTTNPLTTITYSTEKGPLIDLTNNALEVNEEYFSDINFIVEE